MTYTLPAALEALDRLVDEMDEMIAVAAQDVMDVYGLDAPFRPQTPSIESDPLRRKLARMLVERLVSSEDVVLRPADPGEPADAHTCAPQPAPDRLQALADVVEKAKHDGRTVVGGGTGILFDGVQIIASDVFARLMGERAEARARAYDAVARLARVNGTTVSEALNVARPIEEIVQAVVALAHGPVEHSDIPSPDSVTGTPQSVTPDVATGTDTVDPWELRSQIESLEYHLRNAQTAASKGYRESLRLQTVLAEANALEQERNDAVARLARLTPEAVRVAVQVGAWIPDHQKDSMVRRVLGIVDPNVTARDLQDMHPIVDVQAAGRPIRDEPQG